MMQISFGITVSSEYVEIQNLIKTLLLFKRHIDEIVVQMDSQTGTQEVKKFCESLASQNKIRFIEFPLNKDFASFKNNLKTKCKGNFILQIDADETITPTLIEQLPEILESNPEVEMFSLSRINIVNGITPEHLYRWGWRKDDRNRINFPDQQTRLIKNTPEIHWENKVHEVIKGYKKYSCLPDNDEYCLYHIKEIAKQEKQNALYQTIQ